MNRAIRAIRDARVIHTTILRITNHRKALAIQEPPAIPTIALRIHTKL